MIVIVVYNLLYQRLSESLKFTPGSSKLVSYKIHNCLLLSYIISHEIITML
jgi:hypothetical protein